MGFLKKITRPISRVLDKIVPNELKPALPFLAAAAPFMAPGLMSIGGNTMFSRALMSGGLNLGSQLAQEGSDGDFSGLSTLMAAATGALSTPGSAATTGPAGPPGSELITTPGQPSAADFFSGKAAGMEPGFAKSGLGALEKSSNYLTGVGDTLQNNLFSKEGLKAALIPAGQGMTDLAVAENRRALKAYEQDLADYEASMGDQATNEGRALAIRTAMLRYGFTEDEITDTISSAGYRAGGRVGLKGGGMDAGQMYITEPGIMGNPAVMEKIENMREFMIANPDIEDITDYSEKYESKDPEFEGIKGAVKEINKDEINEVKEISEDNNMFSNLINKVSSVFVDEKGDYRSGLQKAKFVLSDFIAGKGYDFVTGAEWYNKLDEDTQKEILLMKQKIRNNPEAYSFSPRMKQLTEQPIYDEEFAGKFGYGSRYANGGRINAEEGGLMNLGGREMDMRGGGFIPIGKKERADDVPARLSKNEFVMTADAVRAAGGGSVNEGAKRMYETMNRLEARA